jgi:hypothetical protein
MKTIALALLAALVLFAGPSSAQIGEISKQLGLEKKTNLSDDKITSGLKAALQVGTSNAVKSTGSVDGFFGNPAIKILMPEKMRTLEKGLRAIGYGPRWTSLRSV